MFFEWLFQACNNKIIENALQNRNSEYKLKGVDSRNYLNALSTWHVLILTPESAIMAVHSFLKP